MGQLLALDESIRRARSGEDSDPYSIHNQALAKAWKEKTPLRIRADRVAELLSLVGLPGGDGGGPPAPVAVVTEPVAEPPCADRSAVGPRTMNSRVSPGAIAPATAAIGQLIIEFTLTGEGDAFPIGIPGQATGDIP